MYSIPCTRILCNFSMQLLKYFCPPKVEKKPPSKVAQNSSILLFSPIALTTQKVQTEEFLFQNMAYWLTVYRTAVTALYTNLLVIKCLLSWKWHPRSSHIRTPNYLLYNKVGFFSVVGLAFEAETFMKSQTQLFIEIYYWLRYCLYLEFISHGHGHPMKV